MNSHDAFLSNIDHHNYYKDKLSNKDLRFSLSQLYSSSHNICFRHNTTKTVFDVIQSIRSENPSYLLVCNDLLHECVLKPVMRKWPDTKVLKLFTTLDGSLFRGINDCFINQCSKTKSIYIIPHVLSCNGQRIDIHSLTKKIKELNEDNIIIIDGAQALGNISNTELRIMNQNYCDVYISCTHKWVGSKKILGFACFSILFEMNQEKVVSQLFDLDYLGLFGGACGYENLFLSTTDPAGVEETIMKINQVLNEPKGLNSPWTNDVEKIFSDFYNSEDKPQLSPKFFGVLLSLHQIEKLLKEAPNVPHSIVSEPNLDQMFWLRV